MYELTNDKAFAVGLGAHKAIMSPDISNNDDETNPESVIALANNRALVKFDISNNDIRAEGGKALAEALKNNQVMTELNISSNMLGRNTKRDADLSGVTAIGNTIPTMGALAKLIFGADEYQGEFNYETMEYKKIIPEPAILEVGMKEADLSNKDLRVGDAIIVGAWMTHKDNGAMVKLDMSNNRIEGAEAGKALGDALAANTVLQELDLSGGKNLYERTIDAAFAKEIAVGLGANRALTKFDISNNRLWEAGTKAIAEALKGNSIMTELNLAGNAMGKDGAMDIAEIIPTMRAMVTVNVMGNEIGDEQLSKLQEMMQAHLTLVSLCGIAEDAPEANLSGLGMDADDAVVLADELPAKGALTSLDISSNSILPDTIIDKANSYSRGDLVDHNGVQCSVSCARSSYYFVLDIRGIIALADGINNNGAMVKLDMSNNRMATAEAGKVLAEYLAHNSVLKELDVSSNLWDVYRKGDQSGGDGPGFAQELAVGVSTSRALTSVNILGNNIGADQANKLIAIMAIKPNLTTLCGFSRDETKLDLRYKILSTGCGVLLANEVKNNGALTHLNIDHDKCISYLIKTIIFECVAGCRLWPFIHLHNYTKKKKSVEIKEINALAEAFCTNALSGRAGTCSSNVSHPLRTLWQMTDIVDYLL